MAQAKIGKKAVKAKTTGGSSSVKVHKPMDTHTLPVGSGNNSNGSGKP
jgi:hypothetical protein